MDDLQPEQAPAPPPTPTPTPTTPASRARRLGRATLHVSIVGALCLSYAALIEPDWVEVTHHRVGPTDAPADAPALTIVHLTDLHVERLGRRERRVLEVLDEVRPDLVVITGDTVTDSHRTDDLGPARELMAAIVARRPRLGVFACTGNHEDWTGPAANDAIRAAGVDVLEDRVVHLEGGRLALHGLSRPRGVGDAGRPTDAYDIVLCHYPAVLPRVAASGLELVLAGHTHGGQLRVPFVGPLTLPFDSDDYDAGWFTHGSGPGATRLFVSRGVGMTFLPLRFACRPEVAVHRVALAADPGDARLEAR